ncbi:MAG: hypothetical protein ACRDMY_09535 [Gaiellaceae bacterium]
MALLTSACAGGSAIVEADPTSTEALEWTTNKISEAGVTVSYPSGWVRSAEPLLPGLSDPRELVALSTFDARPGGENCAHMPENAIADMGPTEALIVIEERLGGPTGSSTLADYPERPGHFGASNGYPSEAVDCLDRPKEFFDRFIPFRDSGRRFYAYVAFGSETSPAIRSQAWKILDRLEIESSPRP